MHKFAYSVGTGKALCERMLKFARDLKEKDIEPIFVFDGERLDEKQEECVKRREAFVVALTKFRMKPVIVNNEEMEVERTCIGTKPLHEDYKALKIALEMFDIKTAVAQYEAEALCSHLVRQGQASAVLTEDSDAFAYLSNTVILKWNSENESVVLMDQVMKDFQLNPEQFQDLCVLLGNDFNERIKGMGPVKALNCIKHHGTLEKFIEKTQIALTISEKLYKSQKIFRNTCFENTV
jgi:flap endonuclease-1